MSFFQLDVLDEIWDLFESVSEGFLTYSCHYKILAKTGTVYDVSETRSLYQISEKHFVHSKGHRFDPNFLKLDQNVYFSFSKILDQDLTRVMSDMKLK